MNNSVKKYDIKIAVLLLNWNGIEFTVPCIESLLRSSVKPNSIIVVDNASIDDSVNVLKSLFSDIQIIENKSNLGFAGGNNVGLQKILSDNYDYIWVLNNDTIVDENCLNDLIEAMEQDHNIAATTGKIIYEGTSDLIWYAGANINYRTLKSEHVGELQRDKGEFDVPIDVPFISGCCMFLRKSALEMVGVFDNNFFAYSEDFDWCLRAGDLGLRLRYIPQARIYHKVSATFKKTMIGNSGGTSSPLAIYLTTRNRMYIIRKHTKSYPQFLIATTNYLSWIIYYGLALLLLFRIRKLKALLRGVVNGFMNDISHAKP
jgi:GT2 family glycosyltransferase